MQVTYVFNNGSKVTGTVDEILAVGKILKETVDLSRLPTPRGFYKSSSKGLIRIADMNDVHLKNAICSSIRDFYTKLSRAPYTNLSDFLADSTSLDKDPVITDLYREANARAKALR